MERIFPYGHTVHEYYIRKIRRVQKQRRERLYAISTCEEALNQAAASRKAVLESFGPFPEKTPLNAGVTGCIKRKGYTVEKVIFESRPDYRVTANLYVPSDREGPFPCVLGACGHSEAGKAHDLYQYFSQGLAKKGYLVLIYDPVGQGERLQYIDIEDARAPRGCVFEHNMAGNQMRLAGEYLGMWRAWDGIRALDYLLGREEADPTRVGLTGNSGGGTMTTFLNALDKRFTMAAPGCFVTTYVRNIENEEPQDSEQIPPRLFELGCDMADFFIARAPRPVILLAQKKDFFDLRGTVETYNEIKHIYRLLGAEDNIQLFAGPRNHGYFRENREAMYGFFNKHSGTDAESTEDDLVLEKEEDLWCTSSGRITTEGSKKIYSFTAEKAEKLSGSREQTGSNDLRKNVRLLLGIEEKTEPPCYRILRPIQENEDLVRSRFAFETEEGMVLAVLHRFEQEASYSIPEQEAVDLYIPHLDSREEMLSSDNSGVEGEGEGRPLLALDPRGIGEMRAVSCRMLDFFYAYSSDYLYASTSIMLGETYLGGKVRDILSACVLLKENGCTIHLKGRGMGAVAAAFAALFAEGVEQVTLINTLLSFHELTQAPVYTWPLSHFIPGVLENFDIPDIFNVLEKEKPLRIIDPWNEVMEVWGKEA